MEAAGETASRSRRMNSAPGQRVSSWTPYVMTSLAGLKLSSTWTSPTRHSTISPVRCHRRATRVSLRTRNRVEASGEWSRRPRRHRGTKGYGEQVVSELAPSSGVDPCEPVDQRRRHAPVAAQTLRARDDTPVATHRCRRPSAPGTRRASEARFGETIRDRDGSSSPTGGLVDCRRTPAWLGGAGRTPYSIVCGSSPKPVYDLPRDANEFDSFNTSVLRRLSMTHVLRRVGHQPQLRFLQIKVLSHFFPRLSPTRVIVPFVPFIVLTNGLDRPVGIQWRVVEAPYRITNIRQRSPQAGVTFLHIHD